MKHLLYFIPGLRSVDADAVEKAGLSLSIGDCGYAFNGLMGAGPDGTPGVVFVAYPKGTPAPEGKRVGYYPDDQTWVRVPGCWVGWWNDAKPGPPDLARPNGIRGHNIAMLDGTTWTVPAVRAAGFQSNLPTALAIDGDGQLIEEDLPAYRELSDNTARVWQWMCDEETLTFVELVRTVSLAMSLNYRVGIAECSALRLFSTQNIYACAKALCDWPEVLRILESVDGSKKNDFPDGTISTSPSGLTDDTRDTGQRGETCSSTAHGGLDNA